MAKLRDKLLADTAGASALAVTVALATLLMAAADGELSWWWLLAPIPTGLALIWVVALLLYGPELLWLWWKRRKQAVAP